MFENISLAFQGIWGHKMRSFLTMLGIIIGIAAIITIVSTIKGTNDQIKESLIGSGTNAVTVQLYQDNYAYTISNWNPAPEGVLPVSEETKEKLQALDNVVSVSLYCSRRVDSYDGDVCFGNKSYSGEIYGVDEHYFDAAGYRLRNGRGFLAEDFDSFRKVAIVDEGTVTRLFGGADPVGQILEIKNEPFTVVGVVSESTKSDYAIETYRDYTMYAQNTGGRVFIPLADWPIAYAFDEPQTVILKAASTDDMTAIGQQAEDILTDSQITTNQGSFSYKSDDLMGQAAQLQEFSNATNNQLLWIAGISLLVGGIGVMNIMLVTVTERTREIGLKKAIGARKRRILWQFLTEAAALTSIGGILGVAAGLGLSRFIASAMGTPSAVSYPAIAVAVLFSMLIGVVFGMIPAVKAANLNPIDALRRE